MPEAFEQHFANQEEALEAKPKTPEQIKEEKALALVEEIKGIKERMEKEGETVEGLQRITELTQEIINIYESKEEDEPALELISEEQEYLHDIQEELASELSAKEKQKLQEDIEEHLKTLAETKDEEGNLDYEKIREIKAKFRAEHEDLLQKFYEHNIQSTGIAFEYIVDASRGLSLVRSKDINNFLKFLQNPNCKVREISLGCNNIGAEGAQELAKALQNPDCKVREINLGHNNIGDENKEILRGIAKTKGIEIRLF